MFENVRAPRIGTARASRQSGFESVMHNEDNIGTHPGAGRVLPLVDMDPARRWTRELAQLRSRAAKLQSNRSALHPSVASDTLDEALTLCASLLQELAGAHLMTSRLREDVRRLGEHWDYLFDHMAVGCIATDLQGRVLNANRSAAQLLNVSQRHLKDRILLHFVEDRGELGALLRTMTYDANRHEASLTVRPRERAPFPADAVVIPETPDDLSSWLWFFVPRVSVRPQDRAKAAQEVAQEQTDAVRP
jgi:PAS domain-containing protein